VPIDDENMLSVTWHFARVPSDREPYVQTRIPTWHGPVKDELTGRWITTHVMNQDFVAWLGQGAISDRWNEHLGSSDRGVIMIRKRFFDDLDRVARGEDPKAIVRDPNANDPIVLPVANRRALTLGLSRAELALNPFAAPRHYPFQAGQPDDVRRAYDDAMGFTTPPPPLEEMLTDLAAAASATVERARS
jgi:5,5'-dehydrodivanillate O-demethylase